MSDVKAKLAEAGWTYNEKSFWVETWSKTKTGSCGRILVFFGDGSHYRDVTWDKGGRDESGKSFDLVPLPAPEMEFSSAPLKDQHIQEFMNSGRAFERILASELQQARKTIGQQAAEIERLTQERDAAIDRAECRERDHAACREEVENQERQKNAAIELARRIVNQIVANRWEMPKRFHWTDVNDFNQRYGDQPAPTPTCEPLPPANEAPQIEFVRYRHDPAKMYRVQSLDWNRDGRVVKVDCGSIVLTGEFEGQCGGVWRAI